MNSEKLNIEKHKNFLTEGRFDIEKYRKFNAQKKQNIEKYEKMNKEKRYDFLNSKIDDQKINNSRKTKDMQEMMEFLKEEKPYEKLSHKDDISVEEFFDRLGEDFMKKIEVYLRENILDKIIEEETHKIKINYMSKFHEQKLSYINKLHDNKINYERELHKKEMMLLEKYQQNFTFVEENN